MPPDAARVEGSVSGVKQGWIEWCCRHLACWRAAQLHDCQCVLPDRVAEHRTHTMKLPLLHRCAARHHLAACHALHTGLPCHASTPNLPLRTAQWLRGLVYGSQALKRMQRVWYLIYRVTLTVAALPSISCRERSRGAAGPPPASQHVLPCRQARHAHATTAPLACSTQRYDSMASVSSRALHSALQRRTWVAGTSTPRCCTARCFLSLLRHRQTHLVGDALNLRSLRRVRVYGNVVALQHVCVGRCLVEVKSILVRKCEELAE